MKKIIPILGLLLIVAMTFVIPIALADVNFDQPLTAQETQQFDQILNPLMKIYNFIKYAATIVGVLMLVFAGITFITAGGDQAQKEKAKNMGAGVIIGLILIWVAPLVVRYIFG